MILKFIKKLGFDLILIIALIPHASAQSINEEWVARYNGPGNHYDIAYAMSVDTSGNIYITGYSYGSSTGADYATIKYDPNGNELWAARYNGPDNSADIAYELSVDSSGNVHVTGESIGRGTDLDYATVKYNSDGVEQWVARYNGPGNSTDRANALSVDSSGNVYITGQSYTAGSHYDYATIKYDSDGIELWVARYNGPLHNLDKANALSVDSSGNVYVTGESYGSGTGSDYATIKYDSGGNELWVVRFNCPNNSSDIANALAVDASGNVYVTGGFYESGTHYEFATIKYDSNGNELWVARYNGPGDDFDRAYALSVDPSGNVYITGQSYGSGTHYDYATIKYDANGNELWVARYNGPGGGADKSYELSVDTSGNIYVSGESAGSGTGTDYATVKYNSDGDELWVARYNGPGSSTDRARALSVDTSGNVYVAGDSVGIGTSYDYATIKYGPVPVAFDVMPMTCPNTLDINSSLIGVAILGDSGFNVTDINATSIRITYTVAPLRWSIEDIATPYSPYTGKSNPSDCNALGYDGELDLTLKFKTQDIVDALGSVSNGQEIVLKMSGQKNDGTPFMGEDVVVIQE